MNNRQGQGQCLDRQSVHQCLALTTTLTQMTMCDPMQMTHDETKCEAHAKHSRRSQQPATANVYVNDNKYDNQAAHRCGCWCGVVLVWCSGLRSIVRSFALRLTKSNLACHGWLTWLWCGWYMQQRMLKALGANYHENNSLAQLALKRRRRIS